MVTLPLPAVRKALRLWRLVRAAGWPAAERLSDATFTGWEVEFLGVALGMLSDADRAAERDEHVGFLEALRRSTTLG